MAQQLLVTETPKKRILHLCVDDKFIDRASREFEIVAPGVSDYIILGKPRQLNYVKTTDLEFVPLRALYKRIKSGKHTGIIFHSLSNLKALAVIPEEAVVIWVGWGFDYYDMLLANVFPEGLLHPRTANLLAQSAELNKPKIPYSREIRSIVKNLLSVSQFKKRKLLSRVDYFSPVLDIEYNWSIEFNSWFNAKHVCWTYGTAEDDLLGKSSFSEFDAKNILVGNSATPTNNHIEIFDMIASSVAIDDRLIVVPLSYGIPSYRDLVIKSGRDYFGERFFPLTDYVPLEDFHEILANCGTIFMNHLRQQSYATISSMMLQGKKIYLNPQGVMFRWMKDQGAVVSSTEELVVGKNGKRIDISPLTDSERSVNYNLVMSLRSRSVQREKTQNLVRIAMRRE